MQLSHLMMSLNDSFNSNLDVVLWLTDMNLILKQAPKLLTKFALTNSFAQLPTNAANEINLTLPRLRL
jgi:hypothetical protein